MTRRSRVVGTLEIALPPFWETTEQSYDQLQLADKYGLIPLLFTNLNKCLFSSLSRTEGQDHVGVAFGPPTSSPAASIVGVLPHGQ